MFYGVHASRPVLSITLIARDAILYSRASLLLCLRGNPPEPGLN